MYGKEEITAALQKGLPAPAQAKLRQACVAIAGLGGLGSNAAVWLTRLGVGSLLLIDFDRVELSNLNRQYYFLEDVGRYKAEALQCHLRRINPYVRLQPQIRKITPDNLRELLAPASIICEALDAPEAKAMLVNGVLEQLPEAKIVAASGLAGFGDGNLIRSRRLNDRLYLCGDGSSDFRSLPLCGARVGLCAAQQALLIARLLLGMEEHDYEG